MPNDTVEAPFTPEQIEGLTAWQTAGYVHEMTCGSCTARKPLVACVHGMFCLNCGAIQVRVPAMCTRGPGPNPIDALRPGPKTAR